MMAGLEMGSREVKIVIEPCEEGGYFATVPILQGCLAQGETVEETLAEIGGAIFDYVRSCIEDGVPVVIPAESEGTL